MARELAEILQLYKTIIIFMLNHKHLNAASFYLLEIPLDVYT